jgi:serine/threonine protein kinase
LYECLTGQSAFSGSSVLEIGAQIIHVTPPPPSHLNKDVPAELDRITMKALEKKVEERYQSAADLKNELSRVVNSLSGNVFRSPPKEDQLTTTSPRVRSLRLCVVNGFLCRR